MQESETRQRRPPKSRKATRHHVSRRRYNGKGAFFLRNFFPRRAQLTYSIVTHTNIERHANQHRSAPLNRKNRAQNNIQKSEQHRKRKQKLRTSRAKNFFCTQRTSTRLTNIHNQLFSTSTLLLRILNCLKTNWLMLKLDA